MPDKNIVIGVGNLLFCDDGIGVIAVEYLKKNYEFTPELELLDGGTLGFNLHQYFLEYDNVFIIDTISTSSDIGDIFKIPSDELLGSGNYKKTAHEVEVVQMLEICELYEKKAKVTVFGIVPEDIITPNIGLSESLKSKFYELIEIVVKEIESLDIKVEKKDNLSLYDIVKELRCLR